MHLKDERIFYKKWSYEDVIYLGNTLDLELDDAACATVIDYILNAHDAQIGINWDVIEAAIYAVIVDEIRVSLTEE